MPENQDERGKLTYEQKVEMLDEILSRLDNSETPIDKLAEDVKLGARLIKELDKKLKQVEMMSEMRSRSLRAILQMKVGNNTQDFH